VLTWTLANAAFASVFYPHSYLIHL